MDEFSVDVAMSDDPGNVLVTQMLWGHTTHIGCGWLQIDVGQEKWAEESYPGRYENFFVCNYGVGGNVEGQPLYQHPDCQSGEYQGDMCQYYSSLVGCKQRKVSELRINF